MKFIKMRIKFIKINIRFLKMSIIMFLLHRLYLERNERDEDIVRIKGTGIHYPRYAIYTENELTRNNFELCISILKEEENHKIS